MTVAAQVVARLTHPVAVEMLRVDLEQAAELWLGGFLTDEQIRDALTALDRTNLDPAEVWLLWLDYTEALTEWHTAPGWAENARQAAIRAADDLIGGESL